MKINPNIRLQLSWSRRTFVYKDKLAKSSIGLGKYFIFDSPSHFRFRPLSIGFCNKKANYEIFDENGMIAVW